MFATQLDTLPGARMVYSDIGAYMLGRVLERVTGRDARRVSRTITSSSRRA